MAEYLLRIGHKKMAASNIPATAGPEQGQESDELPHPICESDIFEHHGKLNHNNRKSLQIVIRKLFKAAAETNCITRRT